MVWSFFAKKKIDVSVDIHSHLIPGIDDGVKSIDEALGILSFFSSMGYKKIITTPHIRADLFPNTPDIIKKGFKELKESVKSVGLQIDVHCAAEYFIDEQFLNTIKRGEELLTFQENRVLVETSFYNKPLIFDEVIFELQARGLNPILAHPERYQYLEDDLSWLKSIKDKGLDFQMNLLSLVGVYGVKPKLIAKRLIRDGMINFVGSDLHNKAQLPKLNQALNLRTNHINLKNDQFL